MDHPAACRGTTFSLLERVKDFGALNQWSARDCANEWNALTPSLVSNVRSDIIDIRQNRGPTDHLHNRTRKDEQCLQPKSVISSE